MGALSEWLEGHDLADFCASHVGKRPFASPLSARSVIPGCQWETLATVLEARPSDVLVIAHGELLNLSAPRSLAELRELFRSGVGIAVRSPELYCSQLAELCRQFRRDLPGEQRVILFATPAGTHGFSWHYDAEDVFVVQTEGDKEYFFRPNTVAAAQRGIRPDFGLYTRETAAMMHCRMLPGDWLYLPKGFWHMAHAHQDSLSVSIGVFPEP